MSSDAKEQGVQEPSPYGTPQSTPRDEDLQGGIFSPETESASHELNSIASPSSNTAYSFDGGDLPEGDTVLTKTTSQTYEGSGASRLLGSNTSNPRAQSVIMTSSAKIPKDVVSTAAAARTNREKNVQIPIKGHMKQKNTRGIPGLRTWSTYFYVVEDHYEGEDIVESFLKLYNSSADQPNGKKALGVVNLTTKVVMVAQSDKANNRIEMLTKDGKDCQMKCESEEMAAKWLEVMSRRVFHTKRMNQSKSKSLIFSHSSMKGSRMQFE